jgi:hypothetical protein
VKHLVGDRLVKLDLATQAVAEKPLRLYRFDLLHQGASYCDGNLVKITLKTSRFMGNDPYRKDFDNHEGSERSGHSSWGLGVTRSHHGKHFDNQK